jgi:hypothetical protein
MPTLKHLVTENNPPFKTHPSTTLGWFLQQQRNRRIFSRNISIYAKHSRNSLQEGILLKNSSRAQGRNGGWQIYTNRKLKEMRTHKKSSGQGNKWIAFYQCFAAHLIPCSSSTVR